MDVHNIFWSICPSGSKDQHYVCFYQTKTNWMISIKLVECKKSKIVWGSNPNITQRLPPMTRRGVEKNDLLRSLNEEASDPTETEIYKWQDLQQHITMSRGGNSWKLTLPRNENHLTCPTRRHDESKGFPLSTRLWDLLYTITWSTASAIKWTSNTRRHDRSA